ncbi:MAG: DUF86 domain-containing protein [Anaerolineae bacterium]|nr:DUF86 domain-containing protein [Anaerolineae bacterium]
MVRKEVVRKRLRKLDEYLTILQRLQGTPYEEFIANPEKYGSAERFLQLAIETVNDIGSHLVADLGLGPVEWYRDVPERLYGAGYIDQEMREQWIRMIGFRNILVHDYLDVDRGQVYEILQKHLGDFERLQGVFAEFL